MKQSTHLVLSAICGAVFGAAATVAVVRTGLALPDPDYPVAVINLADLVQGHLDSGNITAEGLTEAWGKRDEMAKALSEAGYIVLDGNAVIAAPQRYYVGKPHESKNQ